MGENTKFKDPSDGARSVAAAERCDVRHKTRRRRIVFGTLSKNNFSNSRIDEH